MNYQERKTDRGGYVCMPLKKNVPMGHSGWEPVKCPECQQLCWKTLQHMAAEQAGAIALCTECALRKGAGYHEPD